MRPTWFFVGAFLLAWLLGRVVLFEIDGAGARPVQLVIGALLFAAGLVLTWWGLSTFARLRTGIMPDRPARQLVITGPYRRSRNPMFVGFVGLYLGLALMLNMAWPLVLLPVVILLLNATVVRHEERYLERLFGASYRDYCARVPRWL
jgi:protein-S-isoprenylcysteine O-methyltransferase Ste14